MIVTKGNVTLNLENENHVDAFLASGWVEADASAPAAAEEPKTEEPVEEPVEVSESEEKVEAPAPVTKARGRKKQEK